MALKQSGIPFALIGGYAVWARGGPEPDHDVDFMVADEDARRRRGVAGRARGSRSCSRRRTGCSRCTPTARMVDVIHRDAGLPATREVVEDADELEVLSVQMPVLSATELVVHKLMAMDEHTCDFSRQLPVARALREQVDWAAGPQGDRPTSDYAAAFLFLLERLSIIDARRRVTDGPGDGRSPRRRAIVREGVAVGVATGAYGLSFGAIGVAPGLDVWQTAALSLLMFTGASQFALVGVLASGGSPWSGAATAVLLGTRNGLYGLRLAPLLRLDRLAAGRRRAPRDRRVHRDVGQPRTADRGAHRVPQRRAGGLRPVEPRHGRRRPRRDRAGRPARTSASTPRSAPRSSRCCGRGCAAGPTRSWPSWRWRSPWGWCRSPGRRAGARRRPRRLVVGAVGQPRARTRPRSRAGRPARRPSLVRRGDAPMTWAAILVGGGRLLRAEARRALRAAAGPRAPVRRAHRRPPPGGAAGRADRRAGARLRAVLVVDARLLGLGVAVVALLLRAPFIVVVALAAGAAALVRLG